MYLQIISFYKIQDNVHIIWMFLWIFSSYFYQILMCYMNYDLIIMKLVKDRQQSIRPILVWSQFIEDYSISLPKANIHNIYC